MDIVLCLTIIRSKMHLIVIYFINRIDKDLSVRVADFGLTRDIYETNYYRQHHRSRIPIKWMAPESLNDRISNQKTDVVSSASHAYTGNCGLVEGAKKFLYAYICT